MPTIKQLEDQGRALIADQKALVADESRPWTEKRDEYDKREADIKSILEQHAALKSVSQDPFGENRNEAATEAKPNGNEPPKSLGEQFTSSKGYQALAGVDVKGSRFTSGAIEVDAKANLTTAAGGAGLLQPQYLPGILPLLFQRLTIADLMPSGTASGNSIIYMRESAVTNSAATVAEGGLKPQSDINYTQVTETFKKIANAIKISDEMLQDVPYVQSQVNNRLVFFVQQVEEAQLLSGAGTGSQLTGILTRSGLTAAQAKSTDTAPDAIYKEITKIRTSAFVDPSAIVMHPTDWQNIRLTKDANSQYYAGGPFTGAYGVGPFSPERSVLSSGEMLWNLPVVVTTAATAGTAIVGAFNTCAEVFRKGGITVEMTNANENDFLTNLIAIRAEERLALAVYRPAGFGTVTGL
jgi:HK97 family phage major capsid protein